MILWLLVSSAFALSCGERLHLALPLQVRAWARGAVPGAAAAELAALNARLAEVLPGDFAARALTSFAPPTVPRALTRRGWNARVRSAAALLREALAATIAVHGADSIEAGVAHLSLALVSPSVPGLRTAAELLRDHPLGALARLQLAKAGEPIAPADLTSPLLDDEQNGWLFATGAALVARGDTAEAWLAAVVAHSASLPRLVREGRAGALWRLCELVGDPPMLAALSAADERAFRTAVAPLLLRLR